MPADPPEVCPNCGAAVSTRTDLMTHYECGTSLARDGYAWEDATDRTCLERQSAQLSALTTALRELAAKWRTTHDLSCCSLKIAAAELESLLPPASTLASCPICGGTEHVEPLPGTTGRRCVKCCGVEALLPPEASDEQLS